jgi:thiol-disulfide isomerase/thioredoxin
MNIKKIGMATLAILFAWATPAAAQIEFRDTGFDEALRQARQEGKPLFVDCYTVWCGPCRYMADNVFTLPAAGEWFNARFVCVKIDMEKGEGPELASRYRVAGYPTFLVVGTDGRELHRVVGSGELNDFIARVDVGLTAEKPLATLAGEYENGGLGPHEMTDYWLLLRAAGRMDMATQVSATLFSMLTDDDKLRSVYWPILRARATTPASAEMDFILANRRALEQNNGRETVDKFIGDVFSKAIAENPTDDILDKIATLEGDNRVRLLYQAGLARARALGDAAGYMAAIERNYAAAPVAMSVDALASGGDFLRREDYGRLQQIAAELSAGLPDDAQAALRQRLDNMAARYRRMAHTGVFWETFASFDDALAQARREEYRPVFLYLHTGAPDPVFESAEIGDLLNRRFVNVMIDAASGSDVAARLGVDTFPAAVIVDNDGTVRHTLTGANDLAARLKSLLSESVRSF